MISLPTSLYIHWPFCPYRCHFCPFIAYTGQDHMMGQYHAALKKEILDYAGKCETKPQIKTIFLGGGTPSTYPNELLLDLAETVRSSFAVDQMSSAMQAPFEFTIEVNPGTVKPGQLEVWKQAGI